MKDWRKVVIRPDDNILKAIEIIDKGALQIALVVNDKYRLIGIVTDGNIRRSILHGINLDNPVKMIMNNNPIHLSADASYKQALALMQERKLHHIPKVDDYGILNGLFTIDELLVQERRENQVILMAGGLGTRLGPLTNLCPKPLLNIGDKPILECTLENFIEQGFQDFYISINYRGEMIETYFGDGSKWSANIEYLKEKERLGTAGALSLLANINDKPIIVMNADILTKVDFGKLLRFHHEVHADATMCVREYITEIPYGVVEFENETLKGIEEKPVQRVFTNAGIYVLNPEVLSYIPKGSYYDMPNLFNILIAEEKKTAVFPLREYWIDIGKLDDYEKANGEYREVFK